MTFIQGLKVTLLEVLRQEREALEVSELYIGLFQEFRVAFRGEEENLRFCTDGQPGGGLCRMRRRVSKRGRSLQVQGFSLLDHQGLFRKGVGERSRPYRKEFRKGDFLFSRVVEAGEKELHLVLSFIGAHST